MIVFYLYISILYFLHLPTKFSYVVLLLITWINIEWVKHLFPPNNKKPLTHTHKKSTQRNINIVEFVCKLETNRGNRRKKFRWISWCSWIFKTFQRDHSCYWRRGARDSFSVQLNVCIFLFCLSKKIFLRKDTSLMRLKKTKTDGSSANAVGLVPHTHISMFLILSSQHEKSFRKKIKHYRN